MRRNNLLALAWIVAVAVISACTQSNASISNKVKAKLSTDPAVSARDIQVTTQNGVVTLTGTADTQDAKDRAILLARQTKGVVSVTDMIEVRNEGTNTPGVMGAADSSAPGAGMQGGGTMGASNPNASPSPSPMPY